MFWLILPNLSIFDIYMIHRILHKNDYIVIYEKVDARNSTVILKVFQTFKLLLVLLSYSSV